MDNVSTNFTKNTMHEPDNTNAYWITGILASCICVAFFVGIWKCCLHKKCEQTNNDKPYIKTQIHYEQL